MENTISFNTKFGRISATETKGKVTSIQFKKLKKKGLSSINLIKLRKNINAYFKGEINNIKIPIKIVGNSMQKKIWNELKKIKKGETMSYAQIAKKLKISPRYVGKVCGQNRHILVIPCHRVIRSDGSLAGFSAYGGINLKKRLIQFEKR
tara:strand:+ start:917 stop:1366 length:450 start_codon:yes stop_codon:yes gene_type:complete